MGVHHGKNRTSVATLLLGGLIKSEIAERKGTVASKGRVTWQGDSYKNLNVGSVWWCRASGDPLEFGVQNKEGFMIGIKRKKRKTYKAGNQIDKS